jgi:serine/threonine-protein kinase RsbT
MRVESAFEVESARRAARALAGEIGFTPADTESVVLAVSELAANLVRHAHGGRIELSRIEGSAGMQIESHDHGPGIECLADALQDGFSTVGGLGSGLPAVHRLVDEFEAGSSPAGTWIVCRKWRR